MATTRVCPVESAGSLDNRFRRWLQNPRRILKPYVNAGMTALDLGCGPGFFSLELARMVGPGGRVIAADVQAGMLQKLRDKIQGSEWEQRIRLHQCGKDSLQLREAVDFVLAFYVIHEIPRHDILFRELRAILNNGGAILIAEPPVHVSKKEFRTMLNAACEAGFITIGAPRLLLSKAVVLQKG